MKTIKDCAAAVIFVHNHPSGELQPSEADLNIHRQLTEAGKILGIQVLDHMIVTRKGYYSLQEAGLLGHQT
jgi:DNA repair protein RadC